MGNSLTCFGPEGFAETRIIFISSFEFNHPVLHHVSTPVEAAERLHARATVAPVVNRGSAWAT